MSPKPHGPRVGLARIGVDGLAMFLLSHVVLVLTAGVGLMVLWGKVVRRGRDARVPADCAHILVLGMQLEDGKPTREYRMRLLRACRLARGCPDARILLLGGFTSDSPLSEAQAGAAYLAAMGIDPAHMDCEDGSRHTLENLVRARSMLAGGRGDGMALITSRYHLERSLTMARGLGLHVLPCPAEIRWAGGPACALIALREAWLLHWYHTGRIFARLVRHRGMLSRIG